MIQIEDILRSIIAQMPAIQINPDVSQKPYFGSGNKSELNRHLLLKKEDAYPLIWLMPDEEVHERNMQQCESNCRFIIATRESDINLLNEQRYVKSYKIVLIPVFNYLMNGLETSYATQIMSDKIKIRKIPNYNEAYLPNAEKEDKENLITDIWDVIRFDVKVLFTNNCLNQKIWQ